MRTFHSGSISRKCAARMSADGRVSSPHDLVPRDAPKNCHSWLVTNPRKSFDQANDKRALYYRAARHVLERHNSGARPTPIIGLPPRGGTATLWRPSTRPARPCSNGVQAFRPEQATSPLAPINIGSLSWISEGMRAMLLIGMRVNSTVSSNQGDPSKIPDGIVV